MTIPSSHPSEQRISRLRALFDQTEIDTLLLLSDENRYYFSNFSGKDGSFYESAGALLISRDRLILATDGRYTTQAGEEADSFEVVCCSRGLADALPAILKDLGSSALGFEAGRMSYSLYHRIRDRLEEESTAVALKDVDGLLAGARIKKDPYELESMKRALTLAENVFESFVKGILLPGITEKEAAWMLEQELRQAGAEALSFPIIVAFGDNSALPHAVCGDRKLRKNEPILLDWGVVANGYCSDISRSFVCGRADETYRKVHKTVYEAQQKAIQIIRPGVEARAVDRVAREHIERQGFVGSFVHGLGHGVGLAIHEPPRLGSLSLDILEEGMVFTVEPGIYLPGWGGVRLENMVVVRADGVEVLNRHDSALLEID